MPVVRGQNVRGLPLKQVNPDSATGSASSGKARDSSDQSYRRAFESLGHMVGAFVFVGYSYSQ